MVLYFLILTEKKILPHRYSQVYTDLHATIGNTDPEKDLRWWSHTHGADMAMAWPVFEVWYKGPGLKDLENFGLSILS